MKLLSITERKKVTYKELLSALNYYAKNNPEILNQQVSLEIDEGEFYDIETIYEFEPGKPTLTIELTGEVEELLRNR